MRLFLFVLTIGLVARNIEAAVSALPTATGLGDLSQTTFGEDLALTPHVANNNIPGGDSLAQKQDGVYLGNGNSNGFWSKAESANGVEIGMRVTNRYGGGSFGTGPGGDAVNNGVGVAELEFDEGMKIDYSARILPSSPLNDFLQDLGDQNFRFELGIDIDPSDNVDFVAYDPFTFNRRAGNAGEIQVDHAFLTEGTNPDDTVGVTSAANYNTDIGAATGAQNSMQPFFARDEAGNRITTFLNANPLPDPQATTFAIGQNIVFPEGRYEVYLILLDGSGDVVARTTFSVFMAPSNSSSGALNPVALFSSLIISE